MMKNTVFEEWLDYVSDGEGEELNRMLDEMARSFSLFIIATDICICGSVTTTFGIKLNNGETVWLSGYEVRNDLDGREARNIVETNYKIYIELLWKLYGISIFEKDGIKVTFDYYLNDITELMKKSFGKVPDTGDCETCAMCC